MANGEGGFRVHIDQKVLVVIGSIIVAVFLSLTTMLVNVVRENSTEVAQLRITVDKLEASIDSDLANIQRMVVDHEADIAWIERDLQRRRRYITNPEP